MIRQSTCVSGSLQRIFISALILLIFSVLLFPQPVRSETVISAAIINQNTNWDASGNPYRVTTAVTLAAGYRLTIQPGTVIEFENNGGIACYGQLLALGQTNSPVTFTSTTGNWQGLRFLADDPIYGPSELHGTIIEKGGTLGASVMIDHAQVTIAGSEIRLGAGVGEDGILGNVKGSAIISDTVISGHSGYALHFIDPTVDPQLARLQAFGNGRDAVALAGGGGSLGGDQLWENAGLPYEIIGTGRTVAKTETLTIEPGVTVRFVQSSSLTVNGRLIAAGQPGKPITLTGINPTPGSWNGINIIGSSTSPATAAISFAIIEYGGSGSSGGNLRVEDARVAVQYSRIQHSGGYGVHVATGGLPNISFSHILSNALGGVRTLRADIQVPALNNWWGDPTGPFHPVTNPGGLGNAVGDNVLYNPWLDNPALGGPEATPPAVLQVQVLGRANFVPGSRQTYAISYRNGTPDTLRDAVLVAWLPGGADFRSSTGGGLYWPQREQVFWRLGHLLPGTEGIVAVTVEYQWGLPFGTSDAILAVLAGSNASTNLFLVNDYLTYTPPTVIFRQELDPGQINALVQGNAEAAGRYNAALQAGFRLAYGVATQRSDGVSITEVNLLRPSQPLTWQTIFLSATGVTARTINRDRYTLEAGQTVLTYDRQVRGWQLGNAAAGQGKSSLATSLTYGGCMKNCTQEIVKSKIADKALPVMAIAEKIAHCAAAVQDPVNNDNAVLQCGKEIGSKIPGIGDSVEIGTELGICNVDCHGNPNSHVCTEDKYECANEGFWAWLLGPHKIRYRCNTETGMYFAGETYAYCPYFSKCVINDSGTPSCVDCPPPPPRTGIVQAARSEFRLSSAAAVSLAQPNSLAAAAGQAAQCPLCSPAKDPNAKLGVEGLVAPGQTLTYTVQYENVGAGAAFGVYVLDTLAPEFDITTLSLNGVGYLVGGSRTILWEVGELAPKGQPGSKGEVTFSVRLRSNLPPGTVIVNQATVYFPSVPETTPTNAVVNILQPLAGIDQQVSSTLGRPVSFQLSGVSATGGVLDYQVIQLPSFGLLTGTPPNLTYTPLNKFTGEDHLYFTVSKGLETSQPAQVLIDVIGYWLHLPLVVQ